MGVVRLQKIWNSAWWWHSVRELTSKLLNRDSLHSWKRSPWITSKKRRINAFARFDHSLKVLFHHSLLSRSFRASFIEAGQGFCWIENIVWIGFINFFWSVNHLSWWLKISHSHLRTGKSKVGARLVDWRCKTRIQGFTIAFLFLEIVVMHVDQGLKSVWWLHLLIFLSLFPYVSFFFLFLL